MKCILQEKSQAWWNLFNFPRKPCETAVLHCVEELKKRQKIYELKCSESEVRVNDYNSLILLLWKANIDIQFVAESSLALSHYVTGYVTKAERAPYKKCGRKLVTTVLSMAAYGNLAFEL